MEKPAKTNRPIHDLIRRRWSPRAFSDREIEPEVLATLFEAARWAASSFNEQPWRYILAIREDHQEFERLVGCLVKANQTWACKAGALAMSVAKLDFEHNGKPNRCAHHDLGLALATLSLQALDLGLFVHAMAGISIQQTRDEYNIPDGFEPMAALAIGYPGNPNSLPEPLRTNEIAPRSRHQLQDLVFRGVWGVAALP